MRCISSLIKEKAIFCYRNLRKI